MNQMTEHQQPHFIVPALYYTATFIVLLILTVITVAVAQVDFGMFNVAIALIIASVKAALVVCVFMGLWWDKSFNWILLIGSLACVGIFIAFTFSDTAFRGTIDSVEAGVHSIKRPNNPANLPH